MNVVSQEMSPIFMYACLDEVNRSGLNLWVYIKYLDLVDGSAIVQNTDALEMLLFMGAVYNVSKNTQ